MTTTIRLLHWEWYPSLRMIYFCWWTNGHHLLWENNASCDIANVWIFIHDWINPFSYLPEMIAQSSRFPSHLSETSHQLGFGLFGYHLRQANYDTVWQVVTWKWRFSPPLIILGTSWVIVMRNHPVNGTHWYLGWSRLNWYLVAATFPLQHWWLWIRFQWL